MDQIAGPGETLTLAQVAERTEFLLDGRVVEVSFEEVSSNYVYVIWNFPQVLGEHEATIRIRSAPTTMTVLEYSWRFTVVPGEPTIPGLPRGFQFVRPLPDSTITRQAYRTERLLPPDYVPGFARLGGGVCVGVLGYEIAGYPSYFTAEEVQEMFSIAALDGRLPDSEVIDGGYEIPAGDEVIVIEYPPGTWTSATPVGPRHDVSAHHYKCWVGDLAPGRHQATAVLEWPDGHVTEFTWWFVITE